MSIYRGKLYYIILILTWFSTSIFAQQSDYYSEPDIKYRTALELFQKEKYGAAQEIFHNLYDDPHYQNAELRANAQYYDAVCAAELDNSDAAFKINSFLNAYPEHAKANQARFYLGRMYFENNKYRDAMESFRKVQARQLSRNEQDEYYFKMGYVSLKSDETSRARGYFEKVNRPGSPYFGQAGYYLAHLNYLDGKYDLALKGFQKLDNDPRFKKIVPYYEMQIYYHSGDFDKIIQLGPAAMQDASSKDKDDIAHMVGDAYFRAANYPEAISYLEEYEKLSRGALSRDDNYELAYSYYKTGKYKEAVDNFQKVITVKDSLSQDASYHLGACYLATDQKKYAANAFLSAYKNNVVKNMAEDALFNYIKLSIETSFNPYNESISLLENYLKENPDSDRKDEAYGYMVDLYLSSKNYEAALNSLENIKHRSTALDKAYQKILFYRGIELFNLNEMDDAISLLKKATTFSYDAEIQARANYWIGEAFYHQSNYWAAIKYYGDFLKSPAARRIDFYPSAYYNLGYCYFNRKEYDDAITNFKKFLDNGMSRDDKLNADALLRIGDCYFISKDYKNAISYYDKAILKGKSEMDYALYQKALSEGADGDLPQKISVLKVLMNNYPQSRYRDDALYETALSYLIMSKGRDALSYLDKLIKEYPNSSYTVKALMKEGLIYYNNNENESAIKTLKSVIEKYPGSVDAKEALASLKNIYLDLNRPDEYFSYAKNIPYAEVTASEEDSLNYVSGENLYMQGKCDEAIKTFQKYLSQFPQGAFTVNASFYMAECLMKSGNEDEAMKDYQYVADRPRSEFSEKALVNVAGMEFKAGKYPEALNYFQKLEEIAEYQQNIVYSIAGQMRCYFLTGNYPSAIDKAKKLLATDKVTEDLITEAHVTLARAYMKQDDLNMAQSEYSIASKLAQNELAAEAKYNLAFIAFRQNHPEEAEKQVFELSDKYAAYDYWVAKGFILLADIYTQQGNIFQAKQTLQSVIDNYKGPELGETARQKLKELEQTQPKSN